MNARRLLLVFAAMFALGLVAAAVLYWQRSAFAPLFAEIGTATQQDGSDPADSEDSTSAWPDDAPTPEQLLYSQPQMLQDAVARVLPRTPGKTNLYFVGFAGDGEENVFRNEAEYVEQLFSERFDAGNRTLLLVNNPKTLKQHPLASLSNLSIALDAVAQKMDREEDLLLLFLTSHGSAEHELYVSLDPLPLDQVTPDDLADALHAVRIRHKVIVISACYSGGFIDALKDETTMVITAARADRASFGCGTSAEITDFGRALFVEGMNHHDNFADAFNEANQSIDARETQRDEEHSYPQFISTPRIETKLRQWRASIQLGPPVPFAPAAAPTLDPSNLTVTR